MNQPVRKLTPKGTLSRETILKAAQQEFAAKGFRAASLDSIAESAGMTKGGMMHHFHSKADILHAVLRERYLTRQRVFGLDRANTTDDWLASMSRVVAANEHDDLWLRFFTIIVAESLTEEHPGFETVVDRYQETKKTMTRTIRRVAPHLDEERARLLTSVIFAVMDGLQLQKLIEPELAMAQAFELFIQMLRGHDVIAGS